MQNTSHAVMAQRHEAADSPDDFPTPPWATRALIEHVIRPPGLQGMTCLEPACGAGHMAKALKEYFLKIRACDAHSYSYGLVADFLTTRYEQHDWVITNPPFRLAEEFIIRARGIARHGIAMLVRTSFLETIGRYHRIFEKRPPTIVAQFSERVPMVRGRLDPKASTATSYAWLVWKLGSTGNPRIMWIPPCRKSLERVDDYA